VFDNLNHLSISELPTDDAMVISNGFQKTQDPVTPFISVGLIVHLACAMLQFKLFVIVYKCIEHVYCLVLPRDGFRGLLLYRARILCSLELVRVFKERLHIFNLKIISKTISFEIIISTGHGQFETLSFYYFIQVRSFRLSLNLI